ncbi:MAG: site-specific integrase [Nitrososphaera sp.]
MEAKSRKNAVDRSILYGPAYENFRQAVRSKWTLDPYERRLVAFLTTVKMNPDQFVEAAKNDSGFAEKAIMNYVIAMKQRVDSKEITGATIGGSLKSIRLLLDMNDVSLNWKKIRRILPRARRYALDRIPTAEEVRQIVNHSDIRGKALTLVFVSSGVREGAVDGFELRDYSKINREGVTVAGRLVVYRGDEEQYIAFISAEACESLDAYLAFRERNGEQLKPESPLFRDKFDPVRPRYQRKDAKDRVIAMSPSSIRKYYNRLLKQLGLRERSERRHEFSVHGFRKYFKTKAELAGMKPINVETLMGHSVGISDSYYRPAESELLSDYVKVSDSLSILIESKLRLDIEQAVDSRIQAAVEQKVQDLSEQLGANQKALVKAEEASNYYHTQLETMKSDFNKKLETLQDAFETYRLIQDGGLDIDAIKQSLLTKGEQTVERKHPRSRSSRT